MASTGRRRVALVPSSYHPYIGGVEEHTRHVAKELTARGHAVQVWTVDRGEHLGDREVDGILVRDLATPLPARNLRSLGRFGASGPTALVSWVKAARSFRPDLVHIHCFGPNGPYAMIAAASQRVPVVLSSHGETFMDDRDLYGQSALMRWQLRLGLRRSAQLTACSRAVASDLQSRFGADYVLVVPNGVHPTRTALYPVVALDGKPVVVAVGRFVKVKGFDLLLQAVRESSARPRLVLVGSGPEKTALVELTSALGLTEDVVFTGALDSGEVQDVMAAADVVVVPSRKEAFGIVCLEAWASGTPLIATSRGGPSEFVSHEVDGLIVDPEDVASLASAIDRVLADPELAERLCHAGRTTLKQYSWSRVVEDYESAYERVLVGRRHASS